MRQLPCFNFAFFSDHARWNAGSRVPGKSPDFSTCSRPAAPATEFSIEFESRQSPFSPRPISGSRLVGLLLVLCLMAGCTTIGIPLPSDCRHIDFGPEQCFRICVYKDIDVSEHQVEHIIAAWKREFSAYGLKVDIPWIRDWHRPAFSEKGLSRDAAARPLEVPCDRIFILVGRHIGDFLWGLLLPEILGAVEDITQTKGYAVAQMGSFNQLLSTWKSAVPAVHEAYHLVGCGHGLTRGDCYTQILRIKAAASENRAAGRDFFPGMTVTGRIFRTRSEVEEMFTPYR